MVVRFDVNFDHMMKLGFPSVFSASTLKGWLFIAWMEQTPEGMSCPVASDENPQGAGIHWVIKELKIRFDGDI